MLTPAVKTLCWCRAPDETLETSKENVSSAPKCMPCYAAETPGCPTTAPNLAPCMLGDAPSCSASLGSSATPSLFSCLALVWSSQGKAASVCRHIHGCPALRELRPAPLLLSLQPRGRSSHSLCKPRASLPTRGQAAKFQPRSAFLRHDTSGAPAGAGTRSRRSPERLRYRHTAACVDGSPGAIGPASFLSLLMEVLAKYYKTSSFLSPALHQTPRAGRPPRAVHPLPSSPLLFQAAARTSSFRRSRGTGSRE